MTDSIKLPDGREIVKKPWGKGHTYRTIGGERVPSVTTILSVINKPGLVNWAAREAAKEAIKQVKAANLTLIPTTAELNEIEETARRAHTRIRDDAAEIGVAIHEVIEARLQGKVVEPSREVPEHVVRNVNEFFNDSLMGFSVFERELVVAHPWPFAGTLDAILKIGDKLILIDWKTSSGIYPEMALQVSAYSKAYEYTHKYKVDEAWVVRFPKTNDPVELVVANIDRGWEAFQAAASLHACIEAETLLWQ